MWGKEEEMRKREGQRREERGNTFKSFMKLTKISPMATVFVCEASFFWGENYNSTR